MPPTTLPEPPVNDSILVTVLTLKGHEGWGKQHPRTLANALHLHIGVAGDPRRFPMVLMLQGEHKKDALATILGFDHFDVQTVRGVTNAALPWRPPFLAQVIPAEPPDPEGRFLNSITRATYRLIRQFEFPDTYSPPEDVLLSIDHDHLLRQDRSRVLECFLFHTGNSDEMFESWARRAAPDEILPFLIELLQSPDEWTGFRIMGSVHEGNGQLVWTMQLFRSCSKIDIPVYTSDKAPNVLPRPRHEV